MSVQTINAKDSRAYVIHVNGEALFGIMANVTVESEAGSLSPSELQQVLFSGVHDVQILPYVKKTRDFSDKRTALLTPVMTAAAATEETGEEDKAAAAG